MKNQIGRGARVGLAGALLWIAAAPASALPLISEVFYDATGSDNGKSFVEIHAPAGTSVDGWVVEGINGANGAVAGSVALSGIVPGSGLFVLADDQGDGTSLVLGADQVANFDFQNGPDSIVLRDDMGVLDALGYGVFDAGEVFAGEGSPAPDAPADSSLARLFADLDSDDNASDFEISTPTPGSASFAVPEPHSAALIGLGLAGIAATRTRRS